MFVVLDISLSADGEVHIRYKRSDVLIFSFSCIYNFAGRNLQSSNCGILLLLKLIAVFNRFNGFFA